MGGDRRSGDLVEPILGELEPKRLSPAGPGLSKPRGTSPDPHPYLHSKRRFVLRGAGPERNLGHRDHHRVLSIRLHEGGSGSLRRPRASHRARPHVHGERDAGLDGDCSERKLRLSPLLCQRRGELHAEGSGSLRRRRASPDSLHKYMDGGARRWVGIPQTWRATLWRSSASSTRGADIPSFSKPSALADSQPGPGP